MSEERSLYFEADTRKHQQLVAEKMIACAKHIMDRGMVHDASKLTEEERRYYEEPVWLLNHEDVEYGSAEYKELTALMGKGWTHDTLVNDHHPEFYASIQDMTLFSLLEMLCDWIAASKRKDNSASKAMEYMVADHLVDPQLEAILLNTLKQIEAM